jgi:prephenate dehydratase/chorismate mutase/prephenate dehydratase
MRIDLMKLDKIIRDMRLTDFEILKLLRKRMELSLKALKFDDSFCEADNELEIRENIKKYSGIINTDFAENLYREIIFECNRLKERKLILTGFQGEHGAYGELASKKFSSSFIPMPCREFFDVFEGVIQGHLDYGIVPVENSIEGPVNQVNDLLINTDIYITGEVNVPVNHCLLALPDTEPGEIKVVYSHPQALGQCREFINSNRFEAIAFYDTAGAAMMLSEKRPKASGAIASILCKDLYNLKIIKEAIQDNKNNSTRFFVLSREKNKEEGNKCSVVFSTKHRAGELFSVLKIFSDNNINLTRIESRPVRENPEHHAFLIDFYGSIFDEKIVNILEKIKNETIMFKFLGCYKEETSIFL